MRIKRIHRKIRLAVRTFLCALVRVDHVDHEDLRLKRYGRDCGTLTQCGKRQNREQKCRQKNYALLEATVRAFSHQDHDTPCSPRPAGQKSLASQSSNVCRLHSLSAPNIAVFESS